MSGIASTSKRHLAKILDTDPSVGYICSVCGGSFKVGKAVIYNRSTSFVGNACVDKIDEYLETYPVFLYIVKGLAKANNCGDPWQHDVASAQTSTEQPERRLVVVRPFEKYACEKCNITFTNRAAKMSHVDEKHRI